MAAADKETRIQIRLPLSLEVVAALTQAVGTMWPEATIDMTSGDHITMVVPDRRPKRPSQRRLRDIAAEHARTPEAPEADLNRITADGTVTVGLGDGDEAWQQLAWWAYSVLTATEGATNYVEQKVHTELPDGKPATLVVSAAWAPSRTPHELRRQAEADLQRLQTAAGRIADQLEAASPVRRLEALSIAVAELRTLAAAPDATGR